MNFDEDVFLFKGMLSLGFEVVFSGSREYVRSKIKEVFGKINCGIVWKNGEKIFICYKVVSWEDFKRGKWKDVKDWYDRERRSKLKWIKWGNEERTYNINFGA